MQDEMTNAVIGQKLDNVSSQLREMQATMILWMEQQDKRHLEQQKKTYNSPRKTDNFRSELPRWNP